MSYIMSNSSLVNYTQISPNKDSPRNHKIDTITIHCVVGQASVETLGDLFSREARQASSNYGIGADGRIGMYVEEKDRSWCSSSGENDHRAVTIECASDNFYPYAINTDVYDALISLCADICRRNGIESLKWEDDPELIGNIERQNMTLHRWFSNTECPGEYIYQAMREIAADVNTVLHPVISPTPEVWYRVQVGAYVEKANAERMAQRLREAKFETYMVTSNGYYKVQVGAYKIKDNALAMQRMLSSAGFPTYVTTIEGIPVTSEVTKTVDEIAKEVLQGLWGNGTDRKERITAAGYDYVAVQARVNELLS